MSEYPSRPKFWAMKVIRTLQKTGAANHIGRDAAWLVTTIATLEDVKRYSGPVAFWNPHLMDVTGFSSKGTFVKARATAVEFGWLVYFEGRKGHAATYWTEIPENALPFLGADVLDDAGPDSDQKDKCTPFSGPDSDQQQDGIQPRNRTVSGPHSNLCPVPDSTQGFVPANLSSKIVAVADIATAEWMFDIVKRLQPEHKVPIFARWANDIRLMRELDGRTDAEIRELFQAADRDDFWQSNIRCPAKLRKQWDTLDLKFRKSKTAGSSFNQCTEFENVRAIVNRHWVPDLKNIRDVEDAIGDADLFKAAKLTGISAIADASDRDRVTSLNFTKHLESIRSQRKGTKT